MKTKRTSIFETNSSSVNTLSLFRISEWEKFKAGELRMHVKKDEVDEFGDIIPKLYLSDEPGGRSYQDFIGGSTLVEILDGVVGVSREEYNF